MQFLSANIKMGKWKVSLPVLLWFLLAAFAAIAEIGRNDINNYLIFKNVFWHTIHHQHLYLAYPAEYFDTNHYGPVFSLLIAPFALLPNFIGCFLWCIFNAWVLYFAITQLSLSQEHKNGILLICAIEMMTSIHNVQFNPMLCGWIVLSYVLTEKKQVFWATFFIAAGLYVKLYGVVGLAFFWFTDQKWKFQIDTLPNYYITVPGAVLYALPFFRFSQFKHSYFKLSYLAFALIGVVIFSSSAESPTYVIAVAGISIWYVIQDSLTSPLSLVLLILTFLFTILSPTDLVPRVLKDDFIIRYSLKAFPCFLVWCVLIFQLLRKDFGKSSLQV